jgi:hypothetical protein
MMSPISLMVLVLFWSPLILCKKEDPVCVQHLDSNGAYPCESRPSKEPLSLQYSKAQSEFFYWFENRSYSLI